MTDLDDHDTWAAPSDDAQSGDLYAGVAFLDLDRDFALALTPDDQPLLPVLFSFGLVVCVFEHYTVMVPVTTSLDIQDQDAFARLIEVARESTDYVRLPELDPSVWEGSAVALIFRPQTLTRNFIDQVPAQRVASMTGAARVLLDERLRGG